MAIGAIASGSSAAPAPAQCTFNGQAVASGASVTAYLAASVATGSTCTSQTRTCSNGTLSGSYTFANCTVAAGSACTFNGVTVANGASVTAYLASSVPNGQTCSSETRTCSNGHLSGSDAFASCSVAAATGSSVSPNPAHAGQTVTAVTSGTTTQSYNGTMVVFWYKNSTGALLGRSTIMGANFAAGHALALTSTFTLPTTAAKGTYSVSATIYKDATSGTSVGSIPTFATFTIN